MESDFSWVETGSRSFINYSRNISLVQLGGLAVAGLVSFGSGLVGLRIKN